MSAPSLFSLSPSPSSHDIAFVVIVVAGIVVIIVVVVVVAVVVLLSRVRDLGGLMGASQ